MQILFPKLGGNGVKKKVELTILRILSVGAWIPACKIRKKSPT